MLPLRLTELAEIVGGDLVGDDVVITGQAQLDSRACQPGDLFVAFAGAQVDAVTFVPQALEAGAVGVLAERATAGPTVVVADLAQALTDLARVQLERRRAAGDLQVVALTGSQGKTSVKDLLAAVLSAQAPTVATQGSFNNELGVPLTILRLQHDTRYLVLEMGARGIGHIAQLCALAPPDVAAVLNVGVAHLGEFGSQAAIAQAKGEIVEALPADGVAVLNADDPLVAAMASRTTARVLSVGRAPQADVRLENLSTDDLDRASFALSYQGATESVSLRLLGEHQASNAAMAAGLALALGLPLAALTTSLAEVTTLSRWRMETTETADEITVINDSYNANPDSMRAALKTLATIGRRRLASKPERPGRTIAVLGEMRELGEASAEAHDAIGRLAVRLDINQLIVIGAAAKPLHLGAYLEGSWGSESIFVPDAEAAFAALLDAAEPGDVVLFKASRGARLELLAQRFIDHKSGATQ